MITIVTRYYLLKFFFFLVSRNFRLIYTVRYKEEVINASRVGAHVYTVGGVARGEQTRFRLFQEMYLHYSGSRFARVESVAI